MIQMGMFWNSMIRMACKAGNLTVHLEAALLKEKNYQVVEIEAFGVATSPSTEGGRRPQESLIPINLSRRLTRDDEHTLQWKVLACHPEPQLRMTLEADPSFFGT